jgi:hypothetical protein
VLATVFESHAMLEYRWPLACTTVCLSAAMYPPRGELRDAVRFSQSGLASALPPPPLEDDHNQRTRIFPPLRRPEPHGVAQTFL